MCRWLGPFVLACALPVPAVAQARVESIIPEDARIEVVRLGSGAATRVVAGMELMPGDLVTSAADGASVELTCGPPDRLVRYQVQPTPLRALIDVPTFASCHVNILEGLVQVVAEAPTETSAGGVTLGSTGTQYTVEVRRDGDALVFNCLVLDRSVRVLAWRDREAVQAGEKLVWTADRQIGVEPYTARDLARYAAVFARSDLAAAAQEGIVVRDPTTALRRLTAAHLGVLQTPTDTTRRVELAKEQIAQRMISRAALNLNRANVRTEADLRRFEIDPRVIGDRLQATERVTVDAGRTPQMGRAPVAVRGGGPTTDSDLRLIEEGQVETAIRNLEARVRAGTATSRDYYALARAYGIQDSQERVRSYAGRALVLHATDDLLSAAELRELGELIGRQN